MKLFCGCSALSKIPT